jgi:hypothetical protein
MARIKIIKESQTPKRRRASDAFKKLIKNIEVLLFWNLFLDMGDGSEVLYFEKSAQKKLDCIKHCVRRLRMGEEEFLRLLEESTQKYKDDAENVKRTSLAIHRISKYEAWFD